MHSRETITHAATREKGICLSCGELQAFIQYKMPFSPCRTCGHWNVLHAKAVLRVLDLVRGNALPRVGRVLEARNDAGPDCGKTLT